MISFRIGKKWIILPTIAISILSLSYFSLYLYFSKRIENPAIRKSIYKIFSKKYPNAFSIDRLSLTPSFDVLFEKIKISQNTDFNDRELLFYIDEMNLSISFFQLLKGNIIFKSIHIQNLVSHFIYKREHFKKALDLFFNNTDPPDVPIKFEPEFPIRLDKSGVFIYFPLELKEDINSIIGYQSYNGYINKTLSKFGEKKYYYRLELQDIQGRILVSNLKTISWKLISSLSYKNKLTMHNSLIRKKKNNLEEIQNAGLISFHGALDKNLNANWEIQAPSLDIRSANNALPILENFFLNDGSKGQYLRNDTIKKTMKPDKRTLFNKYFSGGTISIAYKYKSLNPPGSQKISIRDASIDPEKILQRIQAQGDKYEFNIYNSLTQEKNLQNRNPKSNNLTGRHSIKISGNKVNLKIKSKEKNFFKALSNFNFQAEADVLVSDEKLFLLSLVKFEDRPRFVGYFQILNGKNKREIYYEKINAYIPGFDLRSVSKKIIPIHNLDYRGKLQASIKVDRYKKHNDFKAELKLNDIILRLDKSKNAESGTIHIKDLALVANKKELTVLSNSKIGMSSVLLDLKGEIGKSWNDLLFYSRWPKTKWVINVKSNEFSAGYLLSLYEFIQKYITEDLLVQSRDDYKPAFFGATSLGRFARNLEMDLNLDFKALNFFGASFSPFFLSINHRPHRVKIDKFNMEGFNGKYSLAGYINLHYRAPYIFLEAGAKDMDLGKMNEEMEKSKALNKFWNRGFADGIFSFKYSLTGYGARLIRILRSIEDEFKITLTNGVMKNFDLQEKWNRASGKLNLKKDLYDIPVDSFTYRSTKKLFSTQIESLRLKAPGIDLYGSGYRDKKNDQKINFHSTFTKPYSDKRKTAYYKTSGLLENLKIELKNIR